MDDSPHSSHAFAPPHVVPPRRMSNARHGRDRIRNMDARRARSEGVPSVSGSANSRGAKSASRRVAAARANSTSASTPSSGRSATSADQLIVARSRRSASSGGVALRDTSLAAYIRNVKKVATLCDEALERLKTNFQQIPEEVTAIHNKIGGVLKLVDDMKGRVIQDTTFPLSYSLLASACVRVTHIGGGKVGDLSPLSFRVAGGSEP